LPVSFVRLRIAGFKSFAEPAVVEILPGLTGVVGPNGCGKSNVVEALRWAMGESSAKSLRGGEMDDVIFAGTAHRASRNIAEVTLSLDETKGLAPPPFHEQPELEISRRIERGTGSTFRVNGREARARDVQTLFADMASGARSSAMVSQGRVSAIVGARPEERRGVLEEAAGITGLHARRHEAELRLKAAEANLERAEDLRAQLQTQLDGLHRQAKQANRYRTISGTIRAAEAELMALQRARAEAGREAAAAALRAAHEAVAAANEAASGGTGAAREAAERLPALRETEASARTALERHRIAAEQIAAEESRAKAALAAASQRLEQLIRDLAHAQQQQRDAAAAVARLTEEQARLDAEDEAHPPRMAQAEAALVASGEAVRVAEAEANRATEHAADLVARDRALTEALREAEQRARRMAEQVARLAEERGRVAASLVPAEKLAAAEAERARAEQAIVTVRAALEAAERAKAAADQALAGAREQATTTDAARARLAAEAQALAEVLAVRDGERWPPMVDQLAVPAGLEAALGAALGDELESAADISAARHWRDLPPLDRPPALPDGVAPLGGVVRGPAALARALGQIGLVEQPEAAAALQPLLSPGQALVSREGGVWRWDGYTIKAGTPTAAAVRLQQRNRLAGLRARLAEAEQAANAARAARAAAEAAQRDASAAEQQARAARRDADQALEKSRAAASSLAAQAATSAARLDGLDEQAGRLVGEQETAEAALARARAARAALPDPAEGRAAMERSRATLAAARQRETADRNARDTLARAAAGRGNRRRTVGAEAQDWGKRLDDSAARLVEFGAREAECRAEHAALAAAPAAIAARRGEARGEAEAASAAHRRAADALAAAEREAAAADRAARAADAAVSAARETLVRAEGAAATASHAWGTVAERILERFGATPELPAPPADLSPEAEDKARRRFERLTRERDEMGPVNLRAEIEAQELGTQIETITREREELTTAIAKLRGSIGHLNREGRERLTAVFTEVDRHFQQLFSRMFNGGRAQLAMVGSDDPLAAGLEIYAQPPGKKLAALSLLSGGEQALTALSLIFAVFRCNPAPVCVLDEVDAPLDDANVDRFCTLLEDMVRETATRFLVVTHHHLTMARMDRLYGVTMQERGVSRLLSVDLRRAAELVEQPRMAAE
jgi:chromosome segregation protein